jgi:TPP-dependent trihydroxycyclohexane-1,2-dione (THcHDO) dehydratase
MGSRFMLGVKLAKPESKVWILFGDGIFSFLISHSSLSILLPLLLLFLLKTYIFLLSLTGAYGYSLSEFNTYLRHNISIITVVGML